MTVTVNTPPTSEYHQPRSTRVLVVDDEQLIRWSLKQRLADEGFDVVEASTGADAIELFRKGCDLVLLDWLLPDVNGHDVLRQLRSLDPSTPIIMLTAHSSVPHAVDMMKEGAFHYAGKPFDLDEVVETVQRALDTTRLRRELRQVHRETQNDPMIGDSVAIQEVKDMLQRIAASPNATVLVTGESGTGKGLAAKAIHRGSGRQSGPFFSISCSALPAQLLESELFGHEPGAFAEANGVKRGLLERADQGTLFLEDISEIGPDVQARLLRFLEERSFRRLGSNLDLQSDVRIVASSNVDLRERVEAGTFRDDLYYRLAVLTVKLPPLRERKGDVKLLAHYYVDQFNREFSKQLSGISEAALARLEAYHWPGNVRELRNSIERAVLLSDGQMLDAEAFELSEAPAEHDGSYNLPAQGIDIQQLERKLLIQALERANGNRTRAGALLGMNRDQVRYRIEKFSLEDRDPKRRLTER